MYMALTINIRFQLETTADFDKLTAYCNQMKTQYTTDVAKQDKPFKVVIQKLPIDTLPQDIHQDLTDHEFQ